MSLEDKKIIPITPVAEQSQNVSLYAAQKKIHPRSISGFFSKWRWFFVAFTQILFYGLPWLEWGQRQIVLFDLEARRFYIFGLVLYPQDFIYLTGLLIISALSLFLFTAVAGRLWCGFTCPQTVYTEIFMWIEHKIEGDRSARTRLDASPRSAETLTKRSIKHLIWITFSLWTGFTFVGYFVPIRELGEVLLNANFASWSVFWVLFYGFATYGNAGFMREQVCKYMCPYARFQSAMFDRDTLIVSYDTARGEKRGARTKKVDYKAEGLGDCVDCSLCVQVCPVGIDIRNGLQYECIGCGLCADACDMVMDKMQYPRGLVRFSTQNAIDNKWNQRQIIRRVLRPRVLLYATILAALCIGLATSLALRQPFKVDIVSDRTAISRAAPGGMIENVYRMQIMNATESSQRYLVTARGLDGLVLLNGGEVEVGATESRWVTLHLHAPKKSLKPGSHTVHFDVNSLSSGQLASEKASFLVLR